MKNMLNVCRFSVWKNSRSQKTFFISVTGAMLCSANRFEPVQI